MTAKDVDTSTRLPVVYIAGKITDVDGWAVEQNIRKAESLLLEMWHNEIAAVCVHTQGRFFVGVGDYELWLPGDYELIRRCDAVFMVDGWQASPGSVEENAFARAQGKRVFSDLPSLLMWAESWRKFHNGEE